MAVLIRLQVFKLNNNETSADFAAKNGAKDCGKDADLLDFIYSLEDRLARLTPAASVCPVLMNLLEEKLTPGFACIYRNKRGYSDLYLCRNSFFTGREMPEEFRKIDASLFTELKSPAFFDLTSGSYRELGHYQSFGINYLFAIPFFYGENEMGLFLVGQKEESPLSRNDLRFLSTLGKRIAESFNRKLLMSRVEKSEKEWEATFDAIGDSIFIKNKDQVILKANKAARKIITENGSIAHDKGFIYRDKPTPFDKTLLSGEVETGEAFDRNTGRYIYITCYPLTNDDGEVMKVMEHRHDITPLLKAYSRNEILALALKTTRDCIIIYDSNEKILFVNDAVEEMFGYKSSELKGRKFTDVFLKNIPHTHLTGIIHGSFIKGWNGELLQVDKNNRNFPSFTSFSPAYSGQGELMAVLVTIRDITMEKETQKKLFHIEKLKSLGEMISGISHELNNPLTGIIGFAEFLEMRIQESMGTMNPACGFAADCIEDVQCIRTQAERAVKIIRNLLDFSRDQEPSFEEADINDIIRKTLSFMKMQLQEYRVEITGNLQENLPMVLADTHQLQQVFVNLINNACQAMEAFRSDGELIISTFRSGNEIMIRFEDNGPGIRDKIEDKIFEPFFTTKKISKGTGLGLSLSYRIMKNHKGNIDVRNNEMGGATFSLTLPILSQKSVNVGKTEVIAAPEFSNKFIDKNVLIADSNNLICSLIMNVMKVMKFKDAHIATNSDELTDLLDNNRYDLIISSITIPGLERSRLIRRIDNDPLHRNSRIIFTTDDNFSSHHSNSTGRQDIQFLPKPFATGELIELINKMFAAVENKTCVVT